MKNKNLQFRIYSVKFISAVLFLSVFLASCTKSFDGYNTNPDGLSDNLLGADNQNIGGFFPQMQQSIYFNYGGGNWQYQIQQDLNSDIWSGYFMTPTNFNGNVQNANYALVDGWNSWAFSLAYQNVMGPANQVKTKTYDANTSLDFYAVSLILKVEAMHRVCDIYGPIPYTKFGTGTANAYDSQQAAYTQFFTDLTTAVGYLQAFVTKYPGATPFAKFDLIFGGDYTKWIKFANSLRLRLAMRIRYADAATSQAQAEAAANPSNGGLLTSFANGEIVQVSNMVHPLDAICNGWGDIRIGASIVSFMKGFNDPRISKYLTPSSLINSDYSGIRMGIALPDANKYRTASKMVVGPTTPPLLMTPAEVLFLLAEAKLYGYNVGSQTARQYYEAGIQSSFDQYSLGTAAAYIADATSSPIGYTEPATLNPANNLQPQTTVTIKWGSYKGGATEALLEQIITQKWIAEFPEGEEAWAEFRRTGYPALFNVAINNSNGKIPTWVRRINFPVTEYTNNAAEIAKAVTLLGGADNGGTALWWDKKVKQGW